MKYLFTIIIMLVSLTTIAQKYIVITGNVKDTADLSLPGTSIMIKNTKIGTLSDIDGNYSISIPDSLIDKDMVLVFYFIGFKQKEIKLNLSTIKNTKNL